MGARADFYVGIGPDAEWLGSIAFDGNPESVFSRTEILDEGSIFVGHGDEDEWRDDVGGFLDHESSHSTLPDRGWPWPWDDSATSDFAYAYDPATQRVLGSCFGRPWFVVADGYPTNAEYEFHDRDGIGTPTFPDMAARKNVRHDKGSGAIFLSLPRRDADR